MREAKGAWRSTKKDERRTGEVVEVEGRKNRGYVTGRAMR